MSPHQVIREEIAAASDTVASIEVKIRELTATRDRFALFVDAMEQALLAIPEQLEFDLTNETPEKSVD
jgi:hypothetical protein